MADAVTGAAGRAGDCRDRRLLSKLGKEPARKLEV